MCSCLLMRFFQTDRLTDQQTDRATDGQTDGWTDRPTKLGTEDPSPELKKGYHNMVV